MNSATDFSAPLYTTWTEAEQARFREWLHGLLLTEIVTVDFIKRDGTLRTMRCSLQKQYLPASDKRDERQISNTAISVWDLDKESYRSFRFDSVRQTRFTLGYTLGERNG